MNYEKDLLEIARKLRDAMNDEYRFFNQPSTIDLLKIAVQIQANKIAVEGPSYAAYAI